MNKFLIFVEGITDQVFLRDVLKKYFNITLNKEKKGKSYIFYNKNIKIISTDGWEKLSDKTNMDYFNIENPEGNNLVIFDADADVKLREKEIEQIFKNEQISNFKIFLFPNGKNSGNIDDLLITLLEPERKSVFFECFNNLEQCLQKINEFGQLTIPNNKDRIYSFLSTFLGDSKSQQSKATIEKRDYLDENLWNLDHEAIKPLVNFLKENLNL